MMIVCVPVFGQNGSTEKIGIQEFLQNHFDLIKRSSVKTIAPVFEELESGHYRGVEKFLNKWQAKQLWYKKADERLFFVTTANHKTYQLIDIDTGQKAGTATKRELKQIKPNSGVRALIAVALVRFRLISEDIQDRRDSLDVISRTPQQSFLPVLKLALQKETDPALRTRMDRLLRLLAIQFSEIASERIDAINSFHTDLGLDVRSTLNPLLTSKVDVATKVGKNVNIARIIKPNLTVRLNDGSARDWSPFDWIVSKKVELTSENAYNLLAAKGLAPADVPKSEIRQVLESHTVAGKVAGIDVATLDSDSSRASAYALLAAQGKAPPIVSQQEKFQAIENHEFFAVYDEPDMAVTRAAIATLATIDNAVSFYTFIDLALDGISLASIFFLAAIGLAITFGVMRVINMAHGEFIMMGAYSGYVVQQFIANYTLSIVLAIPVAFAVTFLAGVLLERLVVRHLYDRPLETLLATFGVSIALQQLAKNIFGTQARPLTSPDWLDGSLVFNDVIAISWIRVGILGLGLVFLLGLLWVLNHTRFGLETRAVIQNPRMAASMGINPDKIKMLTFGLGSGIAGVAGVAIGLFAKVTSELGSDYIVQSFMTVVIGGVGNIWGTLAGATLIGFLQKLIEYFNPSNTLAAQTYMIIFIIIFIQFRPRGLIALKGRAAQA